MLCLLAALGSGCASNMLAQYMVGAPNHQKGDPLIGDPAFLAYADTAWTQQFSVPVGGQPTDLSVGVLEPGDYKLAYSVEFKNEATKDFYFVVNFSFQPRTALPEKTAVRGTLVLLHGIMLRKESMLAWGLYLAQQGYRVVLVDFRGHGRSKGDWITYGALEAGDMVQVADALQKRGLVSGPFGVLGISFGASIGIEWAARDARVGTLVALQPFSDPRKAIMQYSRGSFYELTKSFSDATFLSAELKAAQLAHFRWEDTDVLAATQKLKVPILCLHGADDTWIPPAHSEAIKARAPQGSALRLVPKIDHLAMTLKLEPMAPEVLAWFNEHLAAHSGGAGPL